MDRSGSYSLPLCGRNSTRVRHCLRYLWHPCSFYKCLGNNEHDTYERSDLVPVLPPLFESGLNPLKLVRASISGCAAKSWVTRGLDQRDTTVFVSRSEQGTDVESNQAVHQKLPTVRAPSSYLSKTRMRMDRWGKKCRYAHDRKDPRCLGSRIYTRTKRGLGHTASPR